MAFGIIRVRKLHFKDLKGTQIHNNREFAPDDLPENITPNGFRDYSQSSEKDLEGAVMDRLEGVALRKDSVVAIEYVCAISKEAMKTLIANDMCQSSILMFCKSFVEEKHGKNNIINCAYHYDEDNCHVHVIAVPLVEKSVKWKNKKGQGEKIENRLCARDFIGGKDKLRELQTDYFNHITTGSIYYANKFKQFGIEFFRGRDARTSKKYYSKMTNYVVGKALTEFYEAQKLHNEKKMSNEQYNAIEAATELKIKAVSDNMEKKMSKDQEQRTNLHKWNQNTPDFGM
jgi:hypothetical protein